jgi:hypothetical protein
LFFVKPVSRVQSIAMSEASSNRQEILQLKKRRLFPPQRMYREYPWQLWAIGWLAVFKALWWLASQPVLPDHILQLLGYKYLIGMVPLLVFGIGIWHRKRWALWGLVAMALVHLVFFAIQRDTFQAFVVQTEFPGLSPILSLLALLFNGPLGDVLILLGFPAMRKHCVAVSDLPETD